MTDKELKHLNRRELLEMMVMQSKKIDRLQQELDDAKEKLANRNLDISKSGSIAEASIKINNVFLSAQTAAEQYLENVKNLRSVTEEECRKLRKETEEDCRRLRKETEEECRKLLKETEEECQKMKFQIIKPDEITFFDID